MSRIAPCAESRNNNSPLHQARAQAVHSALALWRRFIVTPDNIKALASQASVTPEQAEMALDDLAATNRVQLVTEGRRTFVRQVSAESEAA